MGNPHGIDCVRHIMVQKCLRTRWLNPLFQATKHLKMASTFDAPNAVRRTASGSSSSLKEKEKLDVPEPVVFLSKDEEQNDKISNKYEVYRPYILGATALVILGWWVSATVLEATRHRWYSCSAYWNCSGTYCALQDRSDSICMVFHPVRVLFVFGIWRFLTVHFIFSKESSLSVSFQIPLSRNRLKLSGSHVFQGLGLL